MDVFYYHYNIRDSKEQQWISTRCEHEILAEVECPLSRRRELKFSCRDNSKQESSSPIFPYFFRFRISPSSLASLLHCPSLTGARISYTRRWIAARRVFYFPLLFRLHRVLCSISSINIFIPNWQPITRKSVYIIIVSSLKSESRISKKKKKKRIKLESERYKI